MHYGIRIRHAEGQSVFAEFDYILVHMFNAVFTLIHDLALRKRWEKHFPEINVLEEHPTYRLVYW